MNVWNNLPFVRILIAFISGLLLAINYSQCPDIHFILFFIPIVAYFLFQKFFKLNYQLRYIRGIPIVLFFLMFGIKLVKLKTDINSENHFSKIKGKFYLIKISEPPKIKTNTVKIIGEVKAVNVETGWKNSKGKILLYASKNDQASALRYGDVLLCRTTINSTQEPKNPFEFNYKKYLAFHQIHHQAYLGSQNWLVSKTKDKNALLAFSYNLRDQLLNLILSSGIKGDEFAIGSALILGYEDELSNEVIGAFAATGALHVLSVSGLHVGIVFLVFNFLLQFLGESKTAKTIRFIVLISGLWIYALITGLSPSVWRAAAMFSLITIGKLYKKDINTFNIIGCSAFILLCINPFMITEVGFQLSYLAVIGIISLHKKFYELFSFKNKIIDNIWSITCVSIAAQLVTFPLGLLYFHQFPNYFLFSNLVIIPLSTIILYGGILLLAVAKVPVAGDIIGKVLDTLLWLLKNIVSMFENLPYALIEGISITTLDTLFLYGIIIGLFAFWQYKKLRYVNLTLLLASILIAYQIAEKLNQKSQQKIIIYAINNHFAIDFIEGQKNVLLADSVLLNNKDKIRFHVIPNWNNLGINKPFKHRVNDTLPFNNLNIVSAKNYLYFGKTLILNTSSQNLNFKNLKYVPEIIVLNELNKLKFKQLFVLFPKALFVCDGTISIAAFSHLKSKYSGINIRSVLHEGAITLEG